MVQVPEDTKLSDPEPSAKLKQLRTDLAASGAFDGLYPEGPPPLIDGPYEQRDNLSRKMHAELTPLGIPQGTIDRSAKAVSTVSDDERVGIFELHFAPLAENPQATSVAIGLLEGASTRSFEVAHFGEVGVGGDAESSPMLSASELFGLVIAALVLIFTLGAVPAAGLPIVSALISVGLAFVYVLAQNRLSSDVNFLSPVLMLMVGLAVGIDYALFVLARFRSEAQAAVASHSPRPSLQRGFAELPRSTRAELMGAAVSHAGSAVVFAGLTVIVVLLALAVVRIPFLSAMAYAAAIAVAMAVAVSTTLLPALIAVCGRWVFCGPSFQRESSPKNRHARPAPAGARWDRMIRRRPAACLGVAALVLLLCTIPAAGLRLAMPTSSTAPLASQERRAADMITNGFGPGRNAPMSVLVDTSNLKDYQRKAALTRIIQEMSHIDGVQDVVPARAAKDLSGVQVAVFTKYAANDPGAQATMERLRAHSDSLENSFGVKYGVTGLTPVFVDLSMLLEKSVLPYACLVILLSTLILIAVFRSLWIPLIATLGFALSVAATFGLTVAVFQHGWLGLVTDPQPIISFLPVILIGVIFGLAMDYQVFLVTQIRESWLAGHSACDAISLGFARGARVVTAAAAIMIAVFASFVSNQLVFVQTMGFALAVAVLFDAFLVRMTIIPAAMYLLGERAWQVPLLTGGKRPAPPAQ